MIWILIILSIVLNGLFGYLLYALHSRVEKISRNQAIMVEWCNTLRENEEQLLKDFTKLQHEILNASKENRRS